MEMKIATMGITGNYLLNFMIFLQTAGAAITYLIVIGDTIPVLIGLFGFEVNREWAIFFSSLIFVC
jgi:sodium-coupled neutral amino acid transporter 11